MKSKIIVQSMNIFSGKSDEELQTRLNQLSDLKKLKNHILIPRL